MNKTETAANLVREIRKVDIRATALKSKRDALVADLLALGWDSGKQVTTAGPFTVSENNTYDEAVMRSGLTGGQFNLCKKVVLDRAKVKALYPAVYASAKQNHGQKVSF